MKKLLIFSFLCVILLTACHQAKVPSQFEQMKQQPVIYPDYIGVTVPVNIAPLHFQLTGNYD